MNSKKVNWLYFSMILVYFAVISLLWKLSDIFTLSLTMNLICSQLIILIPALACIVFTKTRIKEVLPFRRIKVGTVFMLILFTYLMMPLVTTINAITMLFMDNVVTEMSGAALNMPFFLVFLLIGCFGPICEEVVFRGVVYSGYRKSRRHIGAIVLSAFLFGCFHMNLNQMPYAFLIGIVLAVLMEATGSIWAPIIVHIVFNAHNVILMFVSNLITPVSEETYAESQNLLNNMDIMAVTISVLIMFSAVTTALAVCTLIWIVKHEGRSEHIKLLSVRTDRKRESLISAPLVIAIIICIAYMGFDMYLRRMYG